MRAKIKNGLFGEDYAPKAKDILSQRFVMPPFSTLNTRSGEWQTRKRQWINIGIRSELGRGYVEEAAAYGEALGKPGDLRKRYKDASPGGSPRPAMSQKGHIPGQPIQRGDGHGRPLQKRGLTFNVQDADHYRHLEAGVQVEEEEVIGGTSVFDPVLCELVYSWFAPEGGSVLDPFAGGSVRGIVAGEIGLHYTGVELSKRQVEENRKQAKAIGTSPAPKWINGDSMNIVDLAGSNGPYDLIFSCPPYGDLEVYSDDPNDISNKTLEQFQELYFDIIGRTCELAADNAFACFVVGDYRDAKGFYVDFPSLTIAAFEAAGFKLYNYAILINAIGSLPLRINAQFEGSRKLGKTHQDVIIFAKGQPKEFVKKWPTKK